jgi:hypothetical protein
MMNYLYTKEPPKELKDYFFPRTGKLSPDGTPERISLPSYMKDVYAYGRKPFITMGHKLHPLVSAMIDMFNNRDYYGYEIRNPNDPLVKQLQQEMVYLADQFEPFSFRGARQRAASGESKLNQAQAFLGVNPAPKYIANSNIQNDIEDLYRQRFGGGLKSHDQKQIDNAKRDIRVSLREGNTDEARKKLQEYTDKGVLDLSSRSVKMLFNSTKIPFDIYPFKRLPNEDKQALIEKMSPEEKAKYSQYLKKKKTYSQQELNQIQ